MRSKSLLLSPPAPLAALACAAALSGVAWGGVVWDSTEKVVDADADARQATATFAFVNRSATAVKLTTGGKPCNCSNVKRWETFYAPGQTGHVDITAVVGARTESVQRLDVHTSELGSPRTTLTLRVRAPEVVQVDPWKLQWAKGDAVPKDVAVEFAEGADAGLRDVRTTSGAFGCAVLPQDPARPRRTVLRITPQPAAGPQRGKLILPTTSDNPRIRVLLVDLEILPI